MLHQSVCRGVNVPRWHWCWDVVTLCFRSWWRKEMRKAATWRSALDANWATSRLICWRRSLWHKNHCMQWKSLQHTLNISTNQRRRWSKSGQLLDLLILYICYWGKNKQTKNINVFYAMYACQSLEMRDWWFDKLYALISSDHVVNGSLTQRATCFSHSLVVRASIEERRKPPSQPFNIK